MQEMLIPASKVGLVIGRGGDTIKQLQVDSRHRFRSMGGGALAQGSDVTARGEMCLTADITVGSADRAFDLTRVLLKFVQ